MTAAARALSAFMLALAFTLKWEGGFSRDPRDSGGATNYGVSFRFLEGLPLRESDFDGDGALTWKDVAAMSREDAAGIYERYFWNPCRCGDLPEGVDMVVFDGAVNMGRRRSATFLQEAVNGLFGVKRLEVDGAIGDRTIGAVRELVDLLGSGKGLLPGLLKQRARFYQDLGSGEKYAWALKGWMNRARDLWGATLGGGCQF